MSASNKQQQQRSSSGTAKSQVVGQQKNIMIYTLNDVFSLEWLFPEIQSQSNLQQRASKRTERFNLSSRKDLTRSSLRDEQMKDSHFEFCGTSNSSLRAKGLEASNWASCKTENNIFLQDQRLRSLGIRVENEETSRNLLWLLILSSGMIRSSGKQWINMHGISKEEIRYIQRHGSRTQMLQLRSSFESPVAELSNLRRFIWVEPSIGFSIRTVNKLKEAIGWRKHVIDTG